jgi:hypothetical protein
MTRTSLRLLSSITPKDGFHPTSTTRILLSNHSVLPSFTSSNCTLHLYFTLPPLIFIDPYELANHVQFYTFKHWGTANLELPVHAVPQNNSRLLLNANVPPMWTRDGLELEADDTDVVLEIKVPLHLRYGDPVSGSNSGHHTVEMNWPTGFLACPQDLNDPRELHSQHSPSCFLQYTLFQALNQIMPVLPPEVLSFLDVQTTATSAVSPVLVPIQSASIAHNHNLHPPRIKVRVPVANPTDLRFVEPGMVITILASFFCLVWISIKTSRHMRIMFRNVEIERLKTE